MCGTRTALVVIESLNIEPVARIIDEGPLIVDSCPTTRWNARGRGFFTGD
jgi:hypothetical protein